MEHRAIGSAESTGPWSNSGTVIPICLWCYWALLDKLFMSRNYTSKTWQWGLQNFQWLHYLKTNEDVIYLCRSSFFPYGCVSLKRIYREMPQMAIGIFESDNSWSIKNHGHYYMFKARHICFLNGTCRLPWRASGALPSSSSTSMGSSSSWPSNTLGNPRTERIMGKIRGKCL